MVKAKGKAPASKGRGRRQSPPPRPSPKPSAVADEEEVISQPKEVHEEAGSSGDSSRDVSPVASHPKKKKPKKITDLTDEEEEVMALWIRENECLYNKKLNAYIQKKNQLWDDQAKEMNKDTDLVPDLADQVCRLLKEKLGDGEFTERDEWILSKFSILRAHIYAVKKRTTASVSKIKYPGYPVIDPALWSSCAASMASSYMSAAQTHHHRERYMVCLCRHLVGGLPQEAQWSHLLGTPSALNN